LASGTGLGIGIVFEAFIPVFAGAGAIPLFIPMDIDGTGLGAFVAGFAGAGAIPLFIPMERDGTGLGAFIPCEGMLSAFDSSEKAGLLDKKFLTCWSCASDIDSSFSSISSKEGASSSKWALSVCFSFPKGSMIV